MSKFVSCCLISISLLFNSKLTLNNVYHQPACKYCTFLSWHRFLSSTRCPYLKNQYSSTQKWHPKAKNKAVLFLLFGQPRLPVVIFPVERLFPIQDNFSTVSFFHNFESFLILIGWHPVGDYRADIQTGGKHHFHMIPGFEHFAAINTF